MALRSGVRDTPSDFESWVSWVCDPGGSSPRTIIVRIRSAAHPLEFERLSSAPHSLWFLHTSLISCALDVRRSRSIGLPATMAYLDENSGISNKLYAVC